MDLEYHREYNLNRYARWRSAAIKRLGSVCVWCGSSDDLRFDHIDPQEKSFDLSRGWARAAIVVEAELDKCQLLCAPCHQKKTSGESHVKHGEWHCCNRVFITSSAFAGHRRWCRQ